MGINPLLRVHDKTEEEWNVKLVILSLITGAAVGIIFALFKLPIPAPPALSGIAGIVGIYIGYQLYQWALSHFIR